MVRTVSAGAKISTGIDKTHHPIFWATYPRVGEPGQTTLLRPRRESAKNLRYIREATRVGGRRSARVASCGQSRRVGPSATPGAFVASVCSLQPPFISCKEYCDWYYRRQPS